MRIALVSPYSWTYPGGVTRHIEALAGRFLAAGHDVSVLAPYDPDDALAARLHRGARPQQRPIPDYLVPLGRTIGFPSNGAVSNIAITPHAVQTLRRELRRGYDVVHLHEPVTPVVAWDPLCSSGLPLVGTFHCYSTNPFGNDLARMLGARRRLNRLNVRIAVSEAAAWTGERFFGGHYRVIPNGVELGSGPPASPLPARVPSAEHPVRLVFVGACVERKGLGVLLRAFEALREHLAVELTVIGATEEEIAPLLLERRGVRALGKVDDATRAACLAAADVLVAPSLGGESFGMVLTEAFAAATPVVASDIPGYAGVVRHGVEGLLVPPGDAAALASALRDIAIDPRRRTAMAAAAAAQAPRYAWERVSTEVLGAYVEAIAMPAPASRLGRCAARIGVLPADGERRPPRRLASLERGHPSRGQRARAGARRLGLGLVAAAGLVGAVLALQRVGLDRILASLVTSSPGWVIVGLGLMGASMVLRALAWHAILRAALPDLPVRLRDALQGTFVGVLMSATLPARLGEPSRALIVARRLGRARETLPAVLGTIVAQTLLNLLALLLLGIVVFSSVGVFAGHHGVLLIASVAPLAVLVVVLVTPSLLRRGPASASTRTQALAARLRFAVARVRGGLSVFRRPRLAATATAAQLLAWVLQWLACYVLLLALGLDGRAGLGAAATVLFAVNVTAVLPAAPSNLGVFQAACVAVLSGAYHVPAADALAYGIILQAVELATALMIGMPALVKEGLSWRDVRRRALHAGPVRLAPRETAGAEAAEVA
ncbi:MAG: phosphatidyl-myo-inositol alpha-mannosyltransferase [Solirubrobacteraceae bacterium]|nr:phosphatidyl-myo-inositol alpha-mannosyltransferase [Solirubrobacteraceae bacterium]